MNIAPLLPEPLVAHVDEADPLAVCIVFNTAAERALFVTRMTQLSSNQLTFEQLLMIANCDHITPDHLAPVREGVSEALKAYVQGAIDRALKLNAETMTALHEAALARAASENNWHAGGEMPAREPSDFTAPFASYQQPDGSFEFPASAATCTKAPPGWKCTREMGHDGPCAAEPNP